MCCFLFFLKVPHEALGPSERVYLHEAFDMIAEELDKVQGVVCVAPHNMMLKNL